MVVLETHIVPTNIDPCRLSDYSTQVFQRIRSKSGLKKLIKAGLIRIDGSIGETGTWVNSGSCIELLEADKSPDRIYHLKYDVVYEDEHIAVINKPSGISTSGNQFRTIQNSILYNISLSTEKDALRLPRPVHRLDNATSGLLIIAKTISARINLGKQFENKSVKKEYHAIVIGHFSVQKDKFDQPIEGKESLTEYEVVDCVDSLKNETLSLVKLIPYTGRTHQLRVHLSNAGKPILGDQLYGKEGLILKKKGLFLSATQIKFTHPNSGEKIEFKIPIPYKFESLLKRERRRWLKYNT